VAHVLHTRFAQRLAQLLLSSSTPEALGCGCLLYSLMRRYPKLTCLFEWEGGAPVGGRQFDADCADPSEVGARGSAGAAAHVAVGVAVFVAAL
jgi:hypothetical protein